LWLFPAAEAEEIRAAVAQQSKRIAPTGYRRFDDGSTWVRVVGVERRAYDGPVYSLEVPDAHTIVTTGGLVTHNCFPKDVDAFIHLSRQVGYDFTLLEEVERINCEQRDVVLDKLRNELWHLNEKTVTLLGAAFKPGTDDLREAPAIHLARLLLQEGATVRIYDPVALANVKEELGDQVELFDDPIEACRGAHAAVVTTEWDEVKAIDLEALKDALAYPIVVDGRNVLDGDRLAQLGIHYQAIGKPAPRVAK
jgi:UDP-N-acetyl-D-mannosaminuronate dehydrogenase